jgi:predicted Fe-Mo cluster-binding NifX family protein
MEYKKIAIPLRKKQLSPNFENCSGFIIFTVKDHKCIKIELKKNHHQSEINPHRLANIGVTDVIARGIGINTAIQFNKFKINVFAGVESSKPEQLVEQFLNGSIETNMISQENSSKLL